MSIYSPPKLVTHVLCVASDKTSPTLAAVVSSYFNEPDTYFAIFKFPLIERPFEESPEFADDDFLSSVIGNEAKVLINNSLARVKFQNILLVGLNTAQKTYFRNLPSLKITEIDSLDQVEAKLKFVAKQFGGHLLCRSEEITKGLLFAKHENKKLVCDDRAPQRASNSLKSHGDGLIIIERQNDISDVIAVNYAHAIGADVKFVQPIERQEIDALQGPVQEWKKNKSYAAYEKIVKKIRKQIGYEGFTNYQYLTFFTEGFPYGAILENETPSSHVLRSLREDLFIFNNILREKVDLNFNSALLFSPDTDLGLLGKQEIDQTAHSLTKQNYCVKILVGSQATVTNFDRHGSHYPYDLMHLTSHGGEVDGYHVVEKFDDRRGISHTVEYEEVVGISPIDNDLFQVFRKAIFRKCDGYMWMSPELRKQDLPHYVFEDMRKALFSGKMNKEARRTRVHDPIFGSSHIRCSDSIHQGHFHFLASQSAPVVFNNTCSSWKEIATQIIAAGARGYIGTLWAVKNKTAASAAITFYERCVGKNIITAFHEMVSLIDDETDKDVYIYWGLHFSSLRAPRTLSTERILKELIRAFFSWVEHMGKAKIPEIKRNSREAAIFIYGEIVNNFSLNKGMKSKIEGAREKLLEYSPQEKADEDDMTERGVFDLPNN